MVQPTSWWRGALLALVLMASVVPVHAATQGQASQPEATQEQASQPEADNTVTRIQVHPDGDATWTVRVRTRLRTDDEVATFEAFRSRFRSNRSRFLTPFQSSITRVVAASANATGRSMHARNFSATASIQAVPRRWGVVTYRFEWTNFAAVEGDRLAVGDAFQSGFYLAGNDSLAVTGPPDRRVAAVSPEPAGREGRTVRWGGRLDFPTDTPAVTFVPAETTTAATTTTGGAGDGGRLWQILLGVVVFAALGGVVYWRRERDVPPDSDSRGADASRGPSDSGQAGAAARRGPPDPPRSDGDRVVDLLEASGGQMRQADLVDELDWSKSKVSRVLSDLDEEGRVEKIQLGRENLVRVPDE